MRTLAWLWLVKLKSALEKIDYSQFIHDFKKEIYFSTQGQAGLYSRFLLLSEINFFKNAFQICFDEKCVRVTKM